MFKKTLLALALSSAAMSASAAVLENTTAADQVDLIGKEFVATNTGGVDLSSATITLGAQYSVGDIITLSVSGASFDLTNSTQSLVFAAGTTGSTLTTGLISSAADKLTYRVTAASGDHTGATLAFSGMKLTDASVVGASTISVAFAAETSTGISIDSAATNSANLMKVVDQYSTGFAAATDKLDATISVGSLRTNFGTGVYTDSLLVAINEYAPKTDEVWSTVKGAAPSATKVTLKGDFSFLDTNGDGKVTAADKIASPLATAGGATAAVFATDLQSVVITGPAAFTNAGVTITAANAAGDTTVTNQTFTAETELTYATASTVAVKETATLAAGEWDLDGSSDNIELMPFGAEYAQSITVANRGSVEGAITVTLKAGGMTYSKELSQVAAANSVTNISLAVAAFAAESGITGNAHVNVVVNAPDTNIGVKGVYYHKASADRVLTY
ncbi:MAG: hypothetical protein ACI9C0_000715 [Alteromonadaceae bacterium]|jgi:hypothetical protein